MNNGDKNVQREADDNIDMKPWQRTLGVGDRFMFWCGQDDEDGEPVELAHWCEITSLVEDRPGWARVRSFSVEDPNGCDETFYSLSIAEVQATTDEFEAARLRGWDTPRD